MSRFAGTTGLVGLADPVLHVLVEEVSERLRRGERIDLEAYALSHPDLVESLRRLLPTIEMMAALGSTGDGRVGADDPSVSPSVVIP